MNVNEEFWKILTNLCGQAFKFILPTKLNFFQKSFSLKTMIQPLIENLPSNSTGSGGGRDDGHGRG